MLTCVYVHHIISHGTICAVRNISIHVFHPLTDPITLHTHDAGGSGAGLLNLSNISTTTVPQHPCKHHPNLPSLNDNTKTCLLTLSFSSHLLFLLLFLPPSPYPSPPFSLSPPHFPDATVAVSSVMVIVLVLLIPVWFFLAYRNGSTRSVLFYGWLPVICAMCISR